MNGAITSNKYHYKRNQLEFDLKQVKIKICVIGNLGLHLTNFNFTLLKTLFDLKKETVTLFGNQS